MTRRKLVESLVLSLVVGWSFHLPAQGFSTGVPIAFSIDPSTIRQKNKETSQVEATVTLKTPSPTFFICEIRSAEGSKIYFPTIIFKKGDLTGKSEGLVHWKAILKDCRVKLSAFSTDAPEGELWFTVSLKPKPADDDDAPMNPDGTTTPPSQ